MEKLKIVQIVTSGDREYYVFNKYPEFTYHQISERSIIGKDEGIYKTYIYEAPSTRWKAFAGSEFDLIMDDGKVVHCYGQWWNGTNSDMNSYLPKNKVIGLGFSSKDELKKCYVFTGCSYIDKDWLDNLINEYKEEIKKDNRPYSYEYFEYQKMLKNELH